MILSLPQIGLCLVSLVASSKCAVIKVASHTDNEKTGELDGKIVGKVIVFGDSLSDNGSGAWSVSDHTWPKDVAYFGHRFSNGPVWVEILAKRLGMELDDSAIGGATSNNSVVQGLTGPHSTIPVPSLVDQVEDYVKRSNVNSDDLYVIMIGGNDAFFELRVDGVIPAISDAIYSLQREGAKKFLLASYPNLGRLPFRAFSSPSTSKTLEQLSETLQRSLLTLRYQFCHETDVQIGFVDNYSLFRDMMLTPIDYGMDPNTIMKSCLVGAYSEASRTLCRDPDKYIFWDEYHPTRVSHSYMGALAWKASQLLCNN